MTKPIWNQILFYRLLADYTKAARWLDLGCGRGTNDPALVPIRRYMNETLYVGVDLDFESLCDCNEFNRICAAGSLLPFRDATFEVVSSNMVFEHLENPCHVLEEVRRVLMPDGTLIVHTSSSLHYSLLAGRLLSYAIPKRAYRNLVSRFTGRNEKDIFETHFKANTARRLSELAMKCGMRVTSFSYMDTPATFRGRIAVLEQFVCRFLPKAMKSTIFATLRQVP
jgi:ubiquinone/menaquinone biosynthesis C-methylase UbiE